MYIRGHIAEKIFKAPREELEKILMKIETDYPYVMTNVVGSTGYPDIDAEIEAGCKVAAIKLYRQHTKASLTEAKDFIEQFMT